MLLTGDIKLMNVTDPKKPFALIKDVFRNEDVVYGNLEGALYDAVDPYIYFAKTRWRHPGTAAVEALREANFCAVGLANNVMIGEEPIKATLAILDRMGIAHTGAGLDLESACAPAIVERNGVKYGFLQRTSIFWPSHQRAVPSGMYKMPPRHYGHGSYDEGERIQFFGAPGVATLRPRTAYEPSFSSVYEAGGAALIHTWPDPDELAEFVADIQKLRPLVDVLVAGVHWRVTTGYDHGPGGKLVRDFRIEAAHAMIDAGADLVASHGSHELDEIEVYKGKAILYGLGELYYGWTPEGKQPAPRTEAEKVKVVAKVEVRNKRVARVAAIPLISGGWPLGDGKLDEPAFKRPCEVPSAMERLERISAKFGTRLHMGADDITIVG
jgi:poly-gamma-glutamate capsule biosynthesis protein CapA/YwtB (metallophosphatase superfamily)